jgi:hypothetical protein
MNEEWDDTPTADDLTREQCEILLECINWMAPEFVTGWLDWINGQRPWWTMNLENAVRSEQQDMMKKRAQ